MKQIIISLLLAFTVSMGAFGSSSASAACDGATIENTGPDSENIVECIDVTDVRVTCVNNVYVVTSVTQNGETGDGEGLGAISGNATNDNNQTVTIGARCDSEVPVTPTDSTPPATPGRGEETPPTPKSLPNTSGSSELPVAIVTIGALIALSFVGKLGASLYTNRSL